MIERAARGLYRLPEGDVTAQYTTVSACRTVTSALRRHGVLRARDLEALGVSREYLSQLCRRGTVERVARGLYRLPNADVTGLHTVVEACRRVPHGVVCLLSALRFHDVTTQAPYQVWMAVDAKARRPRVPDLPLRIVGSSGAAFREGVEEHVVEGTPIRVYCLAKTVADCFKYRNKIGMDVALEALRETVGDRRVPVDELWHYAKICRVANVIRPYLEAIT
jgi:predicted transcriptional regulator of viral defense system